MPPVPYVDLLGVLRIMESPDIPNIPTNAEFFEANSSEDDLDCQGDAANNWMIAKCDWRYQI
jgi:hypothetical protein